MILRLLLALLLAVGSAPTLAAPAMWEARDADSRVVLFGSIHALPADLDWRTEVLDSAMEAAPLVYFETDVGPLGLTAIAIKALVQQLQTAGEPWLDRLSDEQIDRLATAIVPLGMTLDEAATVPPWVISLQLTELTLRASNDVAVMDAALGVESVLQWELAKGRKAYFETPGEQFDMIAGGTIDQQIEQLFMTLEDVAPENVATLAGLVEGWMAGDVDALVLEPRTESERQVLDFLLAQRNRNWLPDIEQMLADNSENLIIVGGAHLAGEDSVLDLLENAGYTVTRIQ